MRHALLAPALVVLASTRLPAQANYVRDCIAVQAALRDSGQTDAPSAACRAVRAYGVRSASLYLEEDFLQRFGSTSDRNYTMGLGIARSGPMVTRGNHDLFLRMAEEGVDWLSDHTLRPVSVNSFRDHPIRGLDLESLAKSRGYSEMISGTAFTPANLRDSLPVIGDRPYAFLLGWTVARATANPGTGDAWASEFTLGTIGSRLGRNAQRYIHHWSRSHSGNPTPYDPKGWENQIMDVPSLWLGIPTARYSLTWSHLLTDVKGPALTGGSLIDLASDATGELGYYTDASIGLRTRIGLFSAPFWAWRQDPLTAGSRALGATRGCLDMRLICLEAFAYAGGSLRAIGYNAMLQGYPGYSGYHIGWGDRDYFGTEVTTGVASVVWFGHTHVGVQGVFELYANRLPEYTGQYRRSHTWGGLYLTPIW